jgi:hypothetical protein
VIKEQLRLLVACFPPLRTVLIPGQIIWDLWWTKWLGQVLPYS